VALKKKQRGFLFRPTLPASLMGLASLLMFWKCRIKYQCSVN